MLYSYSNRPEGHKWTDEEKEKRRKRNRLAKDIGVVVFAELKRNPNLSWEQLESYTGTDVRRLVRNSSPTMTLEEVIDIAEFFQIPVDRLLHPVEDDRLIFTLLDKREL